MKEKRTAIWKRILAVVLTVALLPVGGVQPVKAAGTVSIQVEYKRSDAESMMGWINDYRVNTAQAASPSGVAVRLDYDKGLEAAAMTRAAEVALVYNRSVQGQYRAENIGYGRSGTDMSIICQNWAMNETDRQNMLNESYTKMGVGHVAYNGYDYWVAVFSDTVGTLPESTLTGIQTISVNTNGTVTKKINTGLASSLNLNVGDTRSFANTTVSAQISGHQPAGVDCPLVEANTLRVTSSDPTVVSVNGTTIRAEKTGKATITIDWGEQRETVEVKVERPQLTIDTISSQNYTGYAITPTITVRQGNTTLRLNIDYTVRYDNNIRTGTAYVHVIGQGAYSGYEGQTTFQIVTPTVANATITTIPDQPYTGNPIYPQINVYDNGRMLQQGVDYDVTYSNNINMGTATVTITGRGTYTGTKTTTFRITGQSLNTATIDAIPDQIYTGSYITPAVTVRLNNLILNQNTDYSVSYQNNRNIGTATITVTGRGNYSGIKSITFRILDRDLNYATVSSIPDQRYTGSDVRPAVTVTLGGRVLQPNVDYTVSYQNNRQPGTATVIVTGAGSYRGSKSTTFRISQASLSSATVKVANQTYNGKAKRPDVTVRLNGEELEEDEDYEVTYSNNKKPGKATVVISGTGYYTGSVKENFIIKPKKQTLKSAKANGNSASLVWTKDANVKGYEIYRSKRRASGYSRIGSFTTNKTTACRNINLSRGTYYYKVRSYVVVDGKKYYGAFSNIRQVTIR